jgi:hypothetical protein
MNETTTSRKPAFDCTRGWQNAAELVANHPGHTVAELAQLSGTERYALACRLPDARYARRVTNGPQRLCTITGRTVQTWFPVQRGSQVA